eukprot:scaffold57157_cov63-Phaeocystis_antarctica.AAC.2
MLGPSQPRHVSIYLSATCEARSLAMAASCTTGMPASFMRAALYTTSRAACTSVAACARLGLGLGSGLTVRVRVRVRVRFRVGARVRVRVRVRVRPGTTPAPVCAVRPGSQRCASRTGAARARMAA